MTRLEELEKAFGGRLGLFALDTGSGASLGYRDAERFPLCSTFKVMAAAALLRASERRPGLLAQRVHYRQSDLVEYSPLTEGHVDDGMTVAALCAAAIQYSDNTAANLLLQVLGGPDEVTAFTRSIGDARFRLDRWETALNSAIPGDPRDTSTPAAMATSLQRLVLGEALAPAQRSLLRDWLRGNTTGAARIQAALPARWIIGDKTGTGSYGTANDVAVLWPLRRAPIVLAIYSTHPQEDAKGRSDIVAAAARIAVDWMG
ncbi:beta-lactamase class A [Noviherbaspirillum humi]|uniref:Beta-lactamase n=2 Tax=Noviherbaspirillum humi TaxID=1688639 RepID=A0A239JQV1_9BURK|nr:beta-lactamase class A [Noviherbaspirillum humi]